MTRDEVKKIVSEKAAGGKLPCKLAFRIAEETGAELAVIGELANELQIKIINCQLGCFK